MSLVVPLLPVTKPASIEIDGVLYYPPLIDSAGHLQVDVLASALPTGAATSAKQTTMITALQLIDNLYGALADVAADELRVNIIEPGSPTSCGQEVLTVPSPGTRVQLLGRGVKALSIAAMPTNTGNIYIGDTDVSDSDGRVLEPGDTIDIAISLTNLLYIDADIADEGITYLWVN